MQRGENVLLNGLLLLLLNAICSKCWQHNASARNALGVPHLPVPHQPSNGSKIELNAIAVRTELMPLESAVSNNCLKMQCTFICFNGKASEIAADIRQIAALSATSCPIIDELRLYSYYFEDNIIAKGFLQEYGNKVRNLYIACANVTAIEGGAFGNGIYRNLYLEDLHLVELRRDFFASISVQFQSLTIVQKEHSIQTLYADFLDLVKYQIVSLTLQVGLPCVRNVTASNNLLNMLVYADFSYNNFGNGFTENTFGQLSMVEHLDLSHSQITYLPDYIFADMASRLEYLDLSYNQLTTISPSIFGWQTISSNLKLMLHNNNWHCTCELQTHLKVWYNYITIKDVLCTTPLRYHSWSVFDVRICYASPVSSTLPEVEECKNCFSVITVTSHPIIATTTTPQLYTTKATVSSTIQHYFPTIPTNEEGIIQMVCLPTLHDDDPNSLHVKNATVEFDIEADVEQARVLLRSDHLNDSYGLLWFSSVTKQYYKMQINYNDYGLGCYGSISYRTVIDNLEPGECYTICVVLKEQMTIPPFNCKSIRTQTNLYTNEWFTEDADEKGIALVVFGIIGFTFMGIMGIYMLLKSKPTLLKGSKRVATSRVNPDEIVVYPKEKTAVCMKQKQEMLAKRCSRSTIACVQRRGSDSSTASYQSYMNANLYEVIPSYLKFNNENSYTDLRGALSLPTDYELPPPIPPPLPLSKSPNQNDMVNYAEIPARTKRTSDDPLPAVPTDQEPLSIDLSENPPFVKGIKSTLNSDKQMNSTV